MDATATNIGGAACPYGCGQHPYFTAGTEFINDCELQLDAAHVLLADERGLPSHTLDVGDGDGDYDFRRPRRVENARIDNAYTGLARDPNGRAWVRLEASDGWTVRLWADEHPLPGDLHRRHPTTRPTSARPWRRADDLPTQCPGQRH